MAQMRAAKERKRIENSEPLSIWIPPEVRRRVVIYDYDFGEVTHEIVCRRSNRIDSYEVMVDGNIQPGRMGWSAVCNLQRKAFVRVGDFD